MLMVKINQIFCQNLGQESSQKYEILLYAKRLINTLFYYMIKNENRNNLYQEFY